jgi:hypothetical protein
MHNEYVIAPAFEQVELIQKEKHCSFNDAFFLYLIELGVFSIDGSGRIWREGYIRCGRFYRALSRVRAETVHYHYNHVTFSCGGGKRRISASKLVYMYFKGPVPDGMSVQNINGERNDNRPENIRLVNLWNQKSHNTVNLITPGIEKTLNTLIRDRVESLEGDSVLCINSHSPSIKKSFPSESSQRLGQILSAYMRDHDAEWNIETNSGHGNIKKYWITKKPNPPAMEENMGVVSC